VSAKQPARLTALRLVGFKSFAERTTIEFGPGISAVVGPNGSGKSNLADALRWTLGEQGRTLRTRRAEDVIFAGSSSRKAIGMADVTLVIDNADRLLPVDFGEVEIGRRLYRSGENEYLLNRQRIRLRDLVELLDAGNLADNAFLFIGQGMVDQALALRPEERRPLFEEAAGVRRHERRRRQAEQELSEAEANLERLRDLLGELRPQAKRLAAQAEQLAARRTAGLELAEALLTSARARWLAAAAVEANEAHTLAAAHAAADSALADLHAAEDASSTTSDLMASHAEQERARREVLEGYRAEILELRVAQARIGADAAALERDLARLAAEREAIEGRLRDAAVAASSPAPRPDEAITAELESVERSLAGLTGVADLEAAEDGDAGHGLTARELAARRTESEQRLQRAQEAESAAQSSREQLAKLDERLKEAELERNAAVKDLAAATARETQGQTGLDAAREAARTVAAAMAATADTVRQLETEVGAARASLAVLDATLDAATDDGLARAVRARGGSLVAEGLEVEAKFRNAVSAALDHAATGFVLDDPAPLLTARRQGTLVVRGGTGRRRGLGGGASGPVVAAAVERGGGALTDALRRDPQSEVSRLLERVVWVPELGAAMRMAASLQPGWRIVTLAGDVVTDEGVIRLASEQSVLDQRAERDALRRRTSELEGRLASEAAVLKAQRDAAETAALSVTAAQRELDAARTERRAAEERERVAQRRAEQWLREQSWEKSQAERLTAEAASAQDLANRTAAELAEVERLIAGASDDDPRRPEREARITELRARRQELLQNKQADDSRLASLEEERRIADVRRAIDEARMTEIDAEQQRLAPRQAELAAGADETAARLAAAEVNREQAQQELAVVLQAGTEDRTRLVEADKAAADARERLRLAEQQTRKSEVSQMEARLQLEQVREQLLVELAGIGPDGLLALRQTTGGPEAVAAHSEPSANGEAAAAPDAASVADLAGSDDSAGSEHADDSAASDADAHEAALALVVAAWQKEASFGIQAPEAASAGRIGTLRRRFHDLGAGNPFAAEEYAELRERLEAMEAQRIDLESAITSTRELIANLTAMITDQFRRTFAALEDAFARRFKELFGGGDAELSLTAPEDLSATGVEIHARPPGKKRQPLSMLSGGERALTAVSLLLAMLEVRPVPFCVLDEVDAALDEANVSRFSKALRGLAEQTQFIVITHNRGTIEGADALYGVTIGDDAVSRVISLRLPKPGANGDAAHELADAAEATATADSSEAALA
jgi:chromosome segregation protein